MSVDIAPPRHPAPGYPAKPRRRVPGGTLRLALAVLRLAAVGYLAAWATMLVWATGPTLTGWSASIITSGSMMPRMQPGDVVIYSPPPAGWKPAIGQVVLIADSHHPGQLMSHRIVRFDHGRLVTKGDANQSEDRNGGTPPEHVRGICRLMVPKLGLGVLRMRHGEPLSFLVQLAVTLTAIGFTCGGGRRRVSGSS